MSPKASVEKVPDADVMRELISFAADQLIVREELLKLLILARFALRSKYLHLPGFCTCPAKRLRFLVARSATVSL